jgi:hypothetical protein
MDFFKTKKIQLSDFQRLVGGVNPYSAAMVKGENADMKKSQKTALGGGLF